jgi:glycosyltransferase involved in cell wall biosynthesis
MTYISVVIPTFNSESTIERCLNSLSIQIHQDFEVCVIDASSSDNTLAIVNKFRAKFQNIRILSESDRGTYDAMNKGIDIARGEWIYFLGSDDEIHDPTVFADIFKVNPDKNYGIVYGNVRIDGATPWAKDGQIYDGEFSIQQLLERNICHQAIFYRTKMFKKLGKYNLRYPICADWELNIKFFTKTKAKYINRIIANFHGGGISSQSLADPIGDDLDSLRKKALFLHTLHKFVPHINFI